MASQPQGLSECKQSQDRLDSLLAGCFTLQKMYGRAPDSMEVVSTLFHSLLGKFPGDKVIKGFETWLERSQEFPTPADIISLIRRNGKPPLSESRYVTISRKDYEYRSREENAYMKQYEAEQDESAWEYKPPEQQTYLVEENTRLRQQVKGLEQENARAWDEVKNLRQELYKPAPEPKLQDKIDRTIEAMKASGAKDEDIEEFKQQYQAA